PLACKTLGVLWLGSGGLGATAIATPWIAWGLGPRFTYARIFDRVFEASLLIAVVLAWRALDLGDATSIGFRSRDAAREIGRGFGFGIAGLAVGLGLCALCGALEPALRFGAAKTVRKAILGVAAALAIGVHAAFVAAFRVGRLFFRLAPAPWLVGAGWPPLVGGFAGMLAITVTGGLVLRHTRWRTFQLDNAPGSGALLVPR